MKQHTVTFLAEDGSVLLVSAVSDGEMILSTPFAEGYWEDEDGNIVDPQTIVVDNDLTLILRSPAKSGELTGPLLETDSSCFDPDGSVTRAETAELIAAIVYQPDAARLRQIAYSDLNTDSECYDAVRMVVSYHLMEGYSDGTFRPDDPITRAEFVAALFRLSGLDGRTGDFSDVPVDYWAAEAIGCAQEQGWISGYDDGRFCPETELTRAEAAVVLRRFAGARLQSEEIAAAVTDEYPYYDVLPEHWAFEDIIELSYRNELLSYLLGEAEAEPGFMFIGDKLCHISAETHRPDLFEAGFQTIDGELYSVSKTGFYIDRRLAGLYELENGMYCVPETDGPFLTNDYQGYLFFGEDGRYTSGSEIVDAAVEELIGDIIADQELSHEDKLYEGFLRVRDGGFFYRSVEDTGWERGTTDWALWAAECMYTQHYGTCYYWAAAFLYVARRLGFQSYPVAGGVGSKNQLHAWVMVEFDDGIEYICDVELEWAYKHNFYGGVTTADSMYKQPLWATNAHYIFPTGMKTDDNGNWGSSYSAWITYDDGMSRGEGDFIVVPEDQQVPLDGPDIGTETGEEADDETDIEPGEETGGETGEETGGEPGTEIGGETGGEIGGETGGEIGGETGGDTGGDTGGETGGDTGGNAGGTEPVAEPAPAPAEDGAEE